MRSGLFLQYFPHWYPLLKIQPFCAAILKFQGRNVIGGILLVSFHLLHAFLCESVFWFQKFSMPHTNCSCCKIDLIFLFLMRRMTLKMWFCVNCFYGSLFSPCRQSNIDGLLRQLCNFPPCWFSRPDSEQPRVTLPDLRADLALSRFD